MCHGHSFPVTPEMQALAEAAQQRAVQDGLLVFDELCAAVVRDAKAAQEFAIATAENLHKFVENKEAAYQVYADALGRPLVTEEEKKQAFLNYVLSDETHKD